MVEISLSHGEMAKVEDRDACLTDVKWTCSTKGYAMRMITVAEKKRKPVWMHRVIWEMHNGPIQSGMYIDHINGDSLDNRLENLRLASNAQNQQNSRKKQTGSSKYKGVYFGKWCSAWRARIKYGKKYESLGYFNTQEDAALAYNRKAIELFGEHANINMIEGVLG